MGSYLTANWPAPNNVHTAISTRQGGHSQSPFDTFNLGTHVGDNPDHVAHNRLMLEQALHLPVTPTWLTQGHSTTAINLDTTQNSLLADASYTRHKNTVCAIMTADCLPILLCNQSGTLACAIHAGWRGLLNGIITQTITQFTEERQTLLIWLGPAIHQQALKLNSDIRQQFIARHPTYEDGFARINGAWHANMYQLAQIELNQLGIHHIYRSAHCTYHNHDLFFSYRRENITGRFASLIWLS